MWLLQSMEQTKRNVSSEQKWGPGLWDAETYIFSVWDESVGPGGARHPFGEGGGCSVLCKIRVRKRTLKVIQLFPSLGLFWSLRREVALTWIAFHCLLAHTARELCPVILLDLQGGLTYVLITTIISVQSSHANPAASISSLTGRGLPSYHCLRGPCHRQLQQVTNQGWPLENK